MSETSEPEPEPQEPDAQPEPPPDPNQVVAAAFTSYIGPKWVPPVVCPVCKTTAWTTYNPVNAFLRYTPNRVLVLIPVSCNNCKHTIFFNGSAIGLFNDDGTPKPPPTESSPATDPESAES